MNRIFSNINIGRRFMHRHSATKFPKKEEINKIDKDVLSYVVFTSLYVSWGFLGMYRGHKLFKYEHEVDVERYQQDLEHYVKMKYDNTYIENYKIKNKPNYFYVDDIIQSFFGMFIYMLPPFVPFMLYKEIKRLEINTRKLDKDINKKEYYRLL